MGGFNFFHLIIWYFVFVVSATLHEAAHALAALKLGDPTAHRGGQVTLNPRPHMKREPWGMIYVPILSFMLNHWILGWASTPFSPDWAWRYPKRSALMSLAGPMANLFLFALSFLLIRVGLGRGVFEQVGPFSAGIVIDGAGIWHPVAMVLGVFFLLNLILLVLNLIPAPPMDGSSVIMLFMPDNTARKWMVMTNSRMMMVVTLVVLLYFFGMIFRPILDVAVELLFR